MNKFALIIYVAILLVISNCLPERDNPYDPKSPYKNNSKIAGRVMTRVGNSIIDAQISLDFIETKSIITTASDSNGNYELEYFYANKFGDSALLFVNKNSYAVVSKTLGISASKSDTINFVLDALPQFTAESVTSYHEAALYPGDIYEVRFSVKITDEDGPGDIESVFVVIPELEMINIMEYYPGNVYKKSISIEAFPDTTLENLIGNDCYFDVLSKSNLRTRSNLIRLNRIIYDVPQTISPLGDTVSQYFNCIWHSINLTFPFTYGVEVYLLPASNIPQIIYQKYDLPSADTMFTMLVNFIPGRYLWQSLIKDDFGNISKSYQTLFYLE